MKRVILQTIELAFTWTIGVIGAVLIGYGIISVARAIDIMVTSAI